MPKLTRKTQKIFCGNADNDQLAVFGSMATGSPVYTDDVEQLQNSTAYGEGWEAATLEDKAPFMEEVNGLQYGLSKQIAYTFQEGIPEYDANTTYYIGSIVKTLNEGKPILYASIIDENINNPLTDLTSWEELKLGGGGGLPVGAIIPVTASSSHVPENTLYAGGTEFSGATGQMFRNLWTDYLLTGKLDTCSYSEYQTELTMTGSCYKWAVDTANQKFRIPFVPDKVLVDVADTVGVRGNGIAIGLNDGVNNEGMRFRRTNDYLYLTSAANLYGQSVGITSSSSSTLTDKKAIGLTQDSDNSGIIADTKNAKTYKTIRHYVVVATGSINQSEADWSEFASSLASKANKTDVDGQWVAVPDYPIITTTTAVGDYTVDISDYLPSDNYAYEVVLRCYGYNSTTTDKRIWVGTDLMPIIGTGEASVAPFGVLIDSDRSKYIVNTINFVTLSRTVFVRIFGGALNEANVRLIAYRRIGTNQ